MTKVERVLAMVYGEAVDKLPKGEFYIEDDLIAELLQLATSHPPMSIDFRARVKAYELLGLDALVFMPDQKNLDAPWRELVHWQKESDFFLFALIDGPFQAIGHSYSDFTDFLMDTVKNTDKVERLVRDSIKKSLRLGQEAIASGAHGILIADDIAYNHGLYISPRTMREVFFPYLRELVQDLHREVQETRGRRMPIFFHSDGNIQLILKDLREMGFDGIHSLESVMDIGKVREATGNELCLMGGYDLNWFSSEGVNKVEKLLAGTLQGGRYIFGSSAGILNGGLSAPAVLEVYQYVDKVI